MRCDDAKAYFADVLTGAKRGTHELDSHIAVCPDCRHDLERMQLLWDQLGSIPVDEPTPALRRRFYALLDEAKRTEGARLPNRFRSWLRSPAFFPITAAACLLIGLALGRVGGGKPDTEMSQLRGEVASLRQIVALSLLQNQSASDRLRGVTYSTEVNQPDREVLAALVDRLNYDTNVNVRLAAIDALQRSMRDPMVRQGVRESLARQDSPLVQLALIELMSEARDPQAKAALERLTREASLNPAVKLKAERALLRLE